MPNDAKLGLVVGVGLVVMLAVVFSRKEAPAAIGQTAAVPAASAAVAAPLPASAKFGSRPMPAGKTKGYFRPEYEFVSETQPTASALP